MLTVNADILCAMWKRACGEKFHPYRNATWHTKGTLLEPNVDESINVDGVQSSRRGVDTRFLSRDPPRRGHEPDVGSE